MTSVRAKALTTALLLLGTLGVAGCSQTGSGPTANDRAACASLSTALHAWVDDGSPDWGQVVSSGYTADNAAVNKAAHDLGANKGMRSNESASLSMESACKSLGLGVRFKPDEQFRFTLTYAARQVSYANAVQLESTGHSICSDLRGGSTIQQEATKLVNADVATDVETGVLFGAVLAYCPQFQGALQTWAGSNSG